MTAQILDGRLVASSIRQRIKQQVDKRISQQQRAPGLAVVLVGEDPASSIYVRNKRQACEEVGFVSQAYNLPISTTHQELVALVEKLNVDPAIDGILVQLPLPEQIDADDILDRIHPDKDVDGFHPENLGKLAQRRPVLRPCTPYGIIRLLKYYDIELPGLNAVIVGASNIVGRPAALECLHAGCTVTITHSSTKDLQRHIENAELLIVAAGVMNLVQPEWIKPGAIIVDVGIHRQYDSKLRGDLDFEACKERASWITPVPGGVGPMTIAMLLENTLYAAEKLHAD